MKVHVIIWCFSSFQLACLASKSAKLSYGKLPRFLDCGTEQEEWAEAVEKIQALADNYADEDIWGLQPLAPKRPKVTCSMEID